MPPKKNRLVNELENIGNKQCKMTHSFVKKHVITLVNMRKLEVFTYLLVMIYDL